MLFIPLSSFLLVYGFIDMASKLGAFKTTYVSQNQHSIGGFDTPFGKDYFAHDLAQNENLLGEYSLQASFQQISLFKI